MTERAAESNAQSYGGRLQGGYRFETLLHRALTRHYADARAFHARILGQTVIAASMMRNGGKDVDWAKTKNRKHPATHRVKDTFS